MKKNEIINKIDSDLSELLEKINYSEYVYFIKNNKLLSFYDNIIDTQYKFLLNKQILDKVYIIVKNRKVKLNIKIAKFEMNAIFFLTLY